MRTPVAHTSAAVVLSLALALVGFGAVAAPISPPPPPTEGDITWSVQPANTVNGTRARFEYSTDPGTQVVDFVVVANRGETAAEFSIYATDATNDVETGAFGLLPSDVAPTDIGSWITMDVDSITLQPGQESTIPFNLLIPSDATPGDHVAGIIASITTTAESEGTTVNLEQRVGARLYLRVAGDVAASAEIGGVTSSFVPELNPFAFGRLTVDYTVRNTGNVRMDVNQDLRITGPFGIPLAEITPEPISDLLPRQTVNVSSDIPQIAALFLAFANITVEPGPLGTAGVDSDEGAEGTPSPQPTDPAPAETESTGTDSTDTASTDAESADTAAETDPTQAPPIDASNLDDTVDFVAVEASSTAFAISWTLLILIVVMSGVIFVAVRYVSNTREQMYAAIDDAAAAAREEARVAGPTASA